MKNPKPRPKRPQQHVTGDVAQTSVALILKKWGWTADIVRSDYGEDVECNIFVDGQRTNLYFRCQVKGSKDPEVRSKGDQLTVSIGTSTCRQWIEEYFPIFLVIYDVENDRACWCDPLPQIRADYSRLAKGKISFRVQSNHDLAKSRQALSALVESFYANVFRLEDARLACNVYPVLMPCKGSNYGFALAQFRRPWRLMTIPALPGCAHAAGVAITVSRSRPMDEKSWKTNVSEPCAQSAVAPYGLTLPMTIPTGHLNSGADRSLPVRVRRVSVTAFRAAMRPFTSGCKAYLTVALNIGMPYIRPKPVTNL